MATGPKPNTPKPGATAVPKPPVTSAAKPEVKPAAPFTRSPTADKRGSEQPQLFLFTKENYYLMFAGLVLILIGFFLLAGGKSANVHEFKYDEIYSVRRITIAPIVLLLGFGLEIYAIMKRPKEAQELQA